MSCTCENCKMGPKSSHEAEACLAMLSLSAGLCIWGLVRLDPQVPQYKSVVVLWAQELLFPAVPGTRCMAHVKGVGGQSWACLPGRWPLFFLCFPLNRIPWTQHVSAFCLWPFLLTLGLYCKCAGLQGRVPCCTFWFGLVYLIIWQIHLHGYVTK